MVYHDGLHAGSLSANGSLSPSSGPTNVGQSQRTGLRYCGERNPDTA